MIETDRNWNRKRMNLLDGQTYRAVRQCRSGRRSVRLWPAKKKHQLRHVCVRAVQPQRWIAIIA